MRRGHVLEFACSCSQASSDTANSNGRIAVKPYTRPSCKSPIDGQKGDSSAQHFRLNDGGLLAPVGELLGSIVDIIRAEPVSIMKKAVANGLMEGLK